MGFTSMPTPTITTVCVLTPAGRGAVAVVEVRGRGASEAVSPWFCSASGWSLNDIAVGRIAFGRWGTTSDEQHPGEEVVLVRWDDRIEIHCHGGVAASRAIVRSLVAAGVTAIDHHEWLSTESTEALAAEAADGLMRAPTERAALVLLDQQAGALSRRVRQIVALLRAGDLPAATTTLQELADRWSLGRRLTEPARVVITGPPNAGKSSLLNAMVGYQRAIVFDQPGTTRDVVTATTAIEGWAVELLDTAGLRRAAEGLESAGMQLARQELSQADLVLLVGEASTWLAGQTPAGDFTPWYAHRPQLAVASKCDLLTPAERERLATTHSPLVLTSAVADRGVESLLQAIATQVVPEELPVGTAVPFTERQIAALRGALQSLATGDTGQAQSQLESLLELSAC